MSRPKHPAARGRQVVPLTGISLLLLLVLLPACDAVFPTPAWLQESPPPAATELLAGVDARLQAEAPGWQAIGYEQGHAVLRFYFRDDSGARLALVLESANKTPPGHVEKSARFALYLEPDRDSPPERALLRAVAGLVRQNESDRDFSPPPVHLREWVPNGAPLWLSPARWQQILRAELLVSALCLVLVLAALLALFPEAHRAWEKATPVQRRAAAALILGGLFLRLVVPERLVMVYGGYALINQALAFAEPLRYGSAGPLLYHLLLRLFPGEGAAYLTINTVLGALTLPLAAWWATRYLARPRLFFPLLALLAIMPLLVKDHNSESNMIPAMLAFFVGLLHWERFRRGASRSALFLSVAALVFAALCRPLVAGIAPLALLILEVGRGDMAGLRPQARALLAAAAGALLLLIPNLLLQSVHYNAVRVLGESGNVSGLLDGFTVQWLAGNLFFYPAYTPLALPLLALLALLTAEGNTRRPLVAVFAVGALVVATAFADSPPPSMPRLQAGAMYFFATLAAAGLLQLHSPRVPHPMFQRPKVWVFLLALSSLWPVETLWKPDTDLEEDRALHEIVRHLPSTPVTLARLDYGDAPPTWGVYRDYPDYLFSPPRRRDRLLSLSRLEHLEAAGTLDGAVFVYLGSRCYALEGRRAAQDAEYEHPACARLRARPDLETVWEEAVPNHRLQTDFIWYPESRTLRLGLYRIGTRTRERGE